METKTDIELVKMIKEEENIVARNTLWERYEAKVGSTYFSNLGFYKSVDMELDEFRSEAFFAFCKALEYADPEKMALAKSNFGTAFYYYLWKIKGQKRKEIFRTVQSSCFTDLFSSQNVDLDANSEPMTQKFMEFNEKTGTQFEEQLSVKIAEEVVRSHLSKVNEQDRNILQLYMEDKPILAISKSMGLKYNQVYKFIHRTKKQLTTIYANALI